MSLELERASYPHCDSRVLHAPGECKYCDEYPDHQLQRRLAGVNYTGHYDPEKEICPAEQQRDIETINRWHGNKSYRDK